MTTFFLDQAVEWRELADVLRGRGVPEGDPALVVWRELAWCHLLLTAGLHSAALDHLAGVVRRLTEANNMTAGDAAELLDRLRSFVSARSLPSAA